LKGHVKLLWVLFLQTRMRPLPYRFAKNPTRNVQRNSKKPNSGEYDERIARSWRPAL